MILIAFLTGDKSLASPPPDPSSPALDSPSPPTLPTSVRHLEALVRVHVMMAELCGRGSAQHQSLCLAALGYCYRIWKVHTHTHTHQIPR